MIKNLEKTLLYSIFGGVFSLVIIPFIVTSSTFFPFITGKNFFFRIIVALIVGLWIVLISRSPKYRPKGSYILYAFGALLVSMAISNLLSPNTLKSFWSNFERMEGWVTLFHLFLFFLVLISVFRTKKIWERFWNTSLGVSVLVSFYALLQMGGVLAIHQGSTRVDASFGNAAYLAVYMLFHVFIALWLLIHRHNKIHRFDWKVWLYGLVFVLNTYILFMTATRGAILGLVGGGVVTLLLVALFEKNHARLRKFAVGGLVGVVVLVAMFFALSNTSIVQNSLPLKRLSDISLEDGTTQSRFIIWGMAIDGFKEKPIFGWGQESFNYVFNKNYDPRMYAQEQWFDRAHNVLFDWLVSGGAVGFLLYISLFVLTLHMLWRTREEDSSVAERALIAGALIGYGIHNFFVFDNIVSYIYFVLIIAFVYAIKNSYIEESAEVWEIKNGWSLYGAPAVGVVIAFVFISIFTVRGVSASGALIDALQVVARGQHQQALPYFDIALEKQAFARQEIREQLGQVTSGVASSPSISTSTKEAYLNKAVEEINKQIEHDPQNARLYVFLGSIFSRYRLYDDAILNLEKALELTPNKQNLMLEMGTNYLNLNQDAVALRWFKDAYELDTSFDLALQAYAMGAIYNGNIALANQLLEERYGTTAVPSDLIIKAYFDTGNLSEVIRLWRANVEANPNNPQLRFSLAASYLDVGDRAGALSVLRDARGDFPQYADQIDYYISEIEAGRNP